MVLKCQRVCVYYIQLDPLHICIDELDYMINSLCTFPDSLLSKHE